MGSCIATSGQAELSDLERFQLAGQLGNIIGSAEPCGLSIKPAGVSKWIETNVPGGDMGFASQMSGQASAAVVVMEDMSATQRMAHCIAVEAAARGENLLEE